MTSRASSVLKQAGATIHVYVGTTDFEIWLDPDASGHRVGLCIGVGRTASIALTQARQKIELVHKRLGQQLQAIKLRAKSKT